MGLSSLCQRTGEPPSLWLVAAAIACPHICYVLVWINASVWKKIFEQSAVQRFAQLAGAGKCLQFTAVLLWFGGNRQSGICIDLNELSIASTTLGLLLILIGQVLNISVYVMLGTTGVYYGCRLGHKVQWVQGFPFDTVAHPQYIGSALTTWGLLVLLYNQCPEGGVILATCWTALYGLNAVVEAHL